jgi:hypothetical protein
MTFADTKETLERQELEWLLSPDVIGRSNNLTEVLRFICERYFNDEVDRINEYSIAVEALGRRSDFDPQTDTIVRVTVHSLRRRLKEIYHSTGAEHAVCVSIPVGHYAPSFVHRELPSGEHLASERNPSALGELQANGASTGASPAPPQPEHKAVDQSRRWRSQWLAASVVFVVVLLCFAGFMIWKRAGTHRTADKTPAANPAAQAADDALRVLVGAGRSSYIGQSGETWIPDKYCTGGTPFKVADQNFFGTEDPTLFLAGIRGNFHCKFPVRPGLYEVHLLFAETGDVRDISRIVIFSINGGASTNLDIVDDAAGSNTATTKVVAGVSPESDGAIHLDFMNDDSQLNAVEILPAPSDKPLPVRIVAGPTAVRDQQGQTWLSDRDYFGGRRGRYPPLKSPDLAIFGFERIGHFKYVIPVDPKFNYDVKLHFIEHWFGKDNGGSGGVGSRIFDVSCNGSMLLKNFDILADGGYDPVTKVFKGIEPTAQGKIELNFTPVVNYPLINAIEITPEAIAPNRIFPSFDSSR